MKYQKGIIQILLIVGIVAALGVIGYALYTQKINSSNESSLYNPDTVPQDYQTDYTQSGESVGSIQGSEDLDSASASLDAESTTQLDTELNAINSASSGF